MNASSFTLEAPAAPRAGSPRAESLHGESTPERLWQTWSGSSELPPYPLLEGRDRVLVVAAHLGDAVLGLGGSLAVLNAGGAHLRIVVAGSGSGSGSGDGGSGGDDALHRLGLAPETAVHRLGLPDAALEDCEGELADITARMVRGFDLCLAPWTGDADADHESVGRAVAAAGARAGVPVAHYPIRMWQWAEPADLQVPWYLAARIELPGWALAAKSDAIALHEARTSWAGRDPLDAGGIEACDPAYFHRSFEVVFG